MHARRNHIGLFHAAVLAALLLVVLSHPLVAQYADPAAPFSFVENRGQWRAPARFMLDRGMMRVWFAPGEVVYDLSDGKSEGRGHLLRQRFHGSSHVSPVGLGAQDALRSYLKEGRPLVETVGYGEIRSVGLYRGIDARYYESGGALKYDLLLAPGADPSMIRFTYEGATSIAIAPDGSLRIGTSVGTLEEEAPYCYQESNGGRRKVACRFVSDERGIGFELGAYDRARPLVIDPTLIYSSFFGGARNDAGQGITLDSRGNIYVTGHSFSLDFPTTSGAYRPNAPDPINTTSGIFIAKFDPTGTALLFSSYIDGSRADEPSAIEVRNDTVIIAGTTFSPNFPVSGAYDATANDSARKGDGFILGLSGDGRRLLFSTYLGGAEEDRIEDLAIAGNGDIYVVGSTKSDDFPVARGFQGTRGGGEDAFVARLTRKADSLINGSYLGGIADDRALSIATESGGAVWITGWTRSGDLPTLPDSVPIGVVGNGTRDCFVARVWFDGTGGNFGFLMGSSGDDDGRSIAVTDSPTLIDTVYITGRAGLNDFYTNAGGAQGSWFAAKFVWPVPAEWPGSAFPYSRLIPFSGAGEAIQVDEMGRAYIAGSTIGRDTDIVVARLVPDGTSFESVTAGGGGADIPWRQSHLTRTRDLFVTGLTRSLDFPITRNAYDDTLNDRFLSTANDAFVMRFGFDPRPAIFSPILRVLDTLRCGTTLLDSFHVHNLGGANLVIGRSLFIDNGNFTIVKPNSPPGPDGIARDTVKPNDSILYVIRYTRGTLGFDAATLHIESNDSLTGMSPFAIRFRVARAVPAIFASPSPLNFGAVCVGDSARRNDTLRNGGIGPVTIESFQLAGSGGAFSIVVRQPTPPLTLPQGGAAIATLGFRPPRAGLFRDTLLVRVRGCDTIFRIPIEGFGDSAAAEWSSGELRFDPLPRCAVDDTAEVMLINRGNVPLRLLTAELDGNEFEILTSITDPIPVGGSKLVRIRFVPGPAVGERRDTLRIAARECGLAIALPIVGERSQGNGLDADSDTVDFGDSALCATDPIDIGDTLTLRNSGGVPIESIFFLAPSSPFVLTEVPPTPARLESGGSLQLIVRYAPATAGEHRSVLLIPYRSAGCDDTLRVELRGRREDIIVEASTLLIDIPVLKACVAAHDTMVHITNRSSVPITVDSVRLSSRGVTHVIPFSEPRVIGPGDRVRDSLRFSPLQTGVAVDTVIYYLSPCRDSIMVVLRGRKEGVVPGFDEDSLAFPDRLSCDRSTATGSLFLRNNGDGDPARITSARIVGDGSFAVDEAALVGREIAAGSGLPVPVSFTPTTAGIGEIRATLEITLAPCDTVLRRELVGRIIDARLDVRGGSFGPVPVNDRRITTVTLVNPTSLPVRLDSLANVVAPFSIVGGPVFPIELVPGDSIVLTIEFAPLAPGSNEITAMANLSLPCSFSTIVPLSGNGLSAGTPLDTICLGSSVSGLTGEMVELVATTVTSPRALPGGSDIVYHIRYDAGRLELRDILSDGTVSIDEDDSVRGIALIRERNAGALRSPLFTLRFRLLIGAGNQATVRIDSAMLVAGNIPLALCDSAVQITISDRCVITGLSLGKYANRLEEVRPNPAGDWVEVTYQQLEDARAVLRIYDMSGREVLRPFESDLRGGRYTLRFSVHDLPSGGYIYSIEAGTYRDAKKMVIER